MAYTYVSLSQLDAKLKGHFTLWKKTLIQKAYCVYYYILKERRFFYVD